VAEGNRSYVGRTTLKELLQELKEVRESADYTTVWLYGTQGYGKFYLLAALVCYLTAEDKRVVYISDCRALFKTAMEVIGAGFDRPSNALYDMLYWSSDIQPDLLSEIGK